MDIPLMMMSIIPLGLSIQYFRQKNIMWSGSAAFMWLIAGAVTMKNNPADWITLRVYTMFSTVMIIFSFYSAVKMLQQSINPRDDYWDEW